MAIGCQEAPGKGEPPALPLAPREQQPGQIEIERGRDLQVLLRGRYQHHLPTHALEKPSIVGGLRQRLSGHVQRSLERFSAEHLGRLHRPQARSIECARHLALAVSLLDRVGNGHGGNRSIDAVAFDGVQRSPRYPGGLALRFARVLRYREDKTAAEADTIDTVRALSPG